MLNRSLLILAILTVLACASQQVEEQPEVPKDGFVPDSSTAIRIAEAVCIPIYGQLMIQHERPFNAALKGEVWTVTGSLPDGMVGGVAEVRVSKRNGCILGVSHGQ